MERIKQALERARQERAGGAGIAVGAGSRPGRQGLSPSQVDKIDYTETRVVELRDDVKASNRLFPTLDDDAAVAAYKILRTQVVQRMKRERWSTLAITSAGAGAGKTLTSINLAISLAKEVNHTVLLVDLDLRRPSIHRYFGVKSEYGLNDHLQDGVDLSRILFNPGVERLVVLPGREPVFNSSEVLSSPKMVALVQELKSRYPSRIIIFDLPPLLSADDAMVFSPYADCALLVVEDGVTTKAEVRQAMDYLSATQVIGTVLNKSREASAAAYAY